MEKRRKVEAVYRWQMKKTEFCTQFKFCFRVRKSEQIKNMHKIKKMNVGKNKKTEDE